MYFTVENYQLQLLFLSRFLRQVNQNEFGLNYTSSDYTEYMVAENKLFSVYDVEKLLLLKIITSYDFTTIHDQLIRRFTVKITLISKSFRLICNKNNSHNNFGNLFHYEMAIARNDTNIHSTISCGKGATNNLKRKYLFDSLVYDCRAEMKNLQLLILVLLSFSFGFFFHIRRRRRRVVQTNKIIN